MASKNVRDLNDPLRHGEIRRFIFTNKIFCRGLLETKVRDDYFDEVNKIIWPKWKIVHNGGNGKRIRILIGWNGDIWKLQVNLGINVCIAT